MVELPIRIYMEVVRMEDFKTELSRYGKVISCDHFGDSVNIVITDGFSIKATNTFDLIKLIINRFPDLPILENIRTDDNFFSIGLKRK
jgi:hypothetical protein